MDATDDTPLEHLEIWNKKWDDVGPNGKLPTIGEKPGLNDEDVRYYKIPDTTLVIRLWDGNMGQYNQYCFDFFDVVRGTAVNTPNGYEIWLPCYGQLSYGEQIITWEKAMKVDKYPEGEERYSVQEGSQLVLKRTDGDPLFFEIPRRPSKYGIVWAQPQATIPM